MIAAILVAFCSSAAAVYLVAAGARRARLLDRPGPRSAHVTPTPRLGGLGIGFGLVIGSLVLDAFDLLPRGDWRILCATLLVGAMGLVEDLRPLRAALRLLGQFGAAGLAAISAPVTIEWVARALNLPPALAWLGTMLWIVWLTNLFNFMDGINGLSGGQTVLAAIGLGVASLHTGAGGVAALLFVLAASSAAFLLFNFPRASIFMGDSGSTAVGFFFGCIPLLSTPRPLGFGAVAVALALFFLDATSTLFRRALHGERLWEAHRSHWYQRPLALGMTHQAITLRAWVGMVPCAVGAAVWPGAGMALRAAIATVVVAIFLAGVAAVKRLEGNAATDNRWARPSR